MSKARNLANFIGIPAINSSADATAITIDSAELVGIGTASPSSYHADMNNLVVADSGNTGITVASGTSSEGSIAFADGTSGQDAYRGWINYNHNSNFMRFASNGTERMRIDNSGRIGIGTTSPGVSLDISQTNARIKVQDGTNQLNIGLWDGANHRVEGDANRKILITSYHSDGIHLGANGSSHLVIKGGKIGIKNTTPNYPVHIIDGGNTAMYIEGDQTGYTQGAICIAGDTSDTSGYRGQGMYMFNHGADTTWYIGGVYTASDRFDICRKGSTTSFDESAAQSTYSLATFSNSGNLSIDGTLTENSDVSIKDNVQNLSNQLDNINALRPVEYDRNDKLKAGEHEIGLIAQEVESLLPDLVGERNGLKTLDYSRLSVILLKGLQELSAKVTALETK